MNLILQLILCFLSISQVHSWTPRPSIHAARRLKTELPQHVAEERADWLWRASVMARILMDDPKVRNEEENSIDVQTIAPIDDFSKIPFRCPSFPPSDTVPTSVHALRPGDIKAVGALGDSITAGNGIHARTAIGTWMVANRGESFSVGGERSLDEGALTLLNIIRKFNPDVEGGSYCARPRSHDYAGYNAAIPGSTNRGLETQARDLVTKFARDLDVFYDSWKLVTLLIGGNDMCQHCHERSENLTAEKHREGVEMALDVFHQHLPRTFVNLQIMTDVGFVKDLYTNETQDKCHALHQIACPCALSNTTEEMKKLQMDYYKVLTDLVDSGKYDTRDDFVVVVQPFLRDQEPFRTADGSFDMSFFAPDCFHPGHKMHQSFAYMLWNSMLTPVQEKVFVWTEDLGIDYKCPTEEAPYFFTKKNSQL